MTRWGRQGAGLLRRVAAVAAVTALAGYGVAATAVAAGGRPGTPRVVRHAGLTGAPVSGPRTAAQPSTQAGAARPGARVRYAVAQRVCARATPGRLQCDAMRLVPSRKGALGARAYLSPSYSTGPAGGFTPADFASAYRYNPGAATSQTIAIVDAQDDPNALSDLNTFDSTYGLPRETATSFRKVNQAGATAPLPAPDSGWAGEITLDIQTARAVCHHCRIILVEGDAPTGDDLAAAVDTAARLGATEISNSYGGVEDSDPSVQAAYNHPGIVITASTGDDGWYGWDVANDGSASDNAPQTPAAYPSVVAVAGTGLSLNSDGSRQSEQVWNENGTDDEFGNAFGSQGASGGGCSGLFTAPSWQAGVAGYANTGCGSYRLAGDVAADADPASGFDVYDSYGASGWLTYGGTSLASPLVAAMWALAGGSGGVAYPAQSLYTNLRLRSSSVYDVRAGGNSFCAGDTTANCSYVLNTEDGTGTDNPNNLYNDNGVYPGGWDGLLDCSYPYDGGAGTIAADTQCNAAPGYDGPSGVGTPTGLAVFQKIHPTVAITRPGALRLRVAQTWSAARFADPAAGATVARYSWNWGDGTTSVAHTAALRHTFTRAGTHRVALTVTDSFGYTASSSVTITVGVPPTAAISGPKTIRVGVLGTWKAIRVVEKNTGGRIVSRVWKIRSVTIGTGGRVTHRFTTPGRRTLVLVVTDSTGLRRVVSIVVTVRR